MGQGCCGINTDYGLTEDTTKATYHKTPLTLFLNRSIVMVPVVGSKFSEFCDFLSVLGVEFF